MKKTKLIFTAALALGLLFCMNDATAQQAVKKVKAQKSLQAQSNQQTTLKAAPAKTYTYKGKKILQVSTVPMSTPTVAPKPATTTRTRQD